MSLKKYDDDFSLCGNFDFVYNAHDDLGSRELARLAKLDPDERIQIILNRVSSLIVNKLIEYNELIDYDKLTTDKDDEKDIIDKIKERENTLESGHFDFYKINKPINLVNFNNTVPVMDSIEIAMYDVMYVWHNHPCRPEWHVQFRLNVIDNGSDLFIALWDGLYFQFPGNPNGNHVECLGDGKINVHKDEMSLKYYLDMQKYKATDYLNKD